MKFAIFALLFATATVAVYGVSAVPGIGGGLVPVAVGGVLPIVLSLPTALLGSLPNILGVINIVDFTNTCSFLLNTLPTGSVVVIVIQTVVNTLNTANLNGVIATVLAAFNTIAGGVTVVALTALHTAILALIAILQPLIAALAVVSNLSTIASSIIPCEAVPVLQAIITGLGNIIAGIHAIRDTLFGIVNAIVATYPTTAALLQTDVTTLEGFVADNCPLVILYISLQSLVSGTNCAAVAGILGGVVQGLFISLLGNVSSFLGSIDIITFTNTCNSLLGLLPLNSILGSALQSILSALNNANIQAGIKGVLAAINTITGGATVTAIYTLTSALLFFVKTIQTLVIALTTALNSACAAVGSIIIPQAAVPVLQGVTDFIGDLLDIIHQIRDGVYGLVNSLLSINPTLANSLGAVVISLEALAGDGCPLTILYNCLQSLVDGANSSGGLLNALPIDSLLK